jgi:hypothetical protein
MTVTQAGKGTKPLHDIAQSPMFDHQKALL